MLFQEFYVQTELSTDVELFVFNIVLSKYISITIINRLSAYRG